MWQSSSSSSDCKDRCLVIRTLPGLDLDCVMRIATIIILSAAVPKINKLVLSALSGLLTMLLELLLLLARPFYLLTFPPTLTWFSSVMQQQPHYVRRVGQEIVFPTINMRRNLLKAGYSKQWTSFHIFGSWRLITDSFWQLSWRQGELRDRSRSAKKWSAATQLAEKKSEVCLGSKEGRDAVFITGSSPSSKIYSVQWPHSQAVRAVLKNADALWGRCWLASVRYVLPFALVRRFSNCIKCLSRTVNDSKTELADFSLT